MKLTDLAKKPTLIKMTLDDEDVVKQYGEPLEFYSYDRQPMDQFLKFAQGAAKDENVIMEAIRTMVLDENGDPAIPEGYSLPGGILMKTVNLIVNNLGK
jgi:hypothetical protein